MADKLLPCPFCGGEAEYSMIDSSSVIPFGIVNHFVTCKNHCLEGLYSRGNTKEEAIEAWNNRPSPWHTGTPTEEGWYVLHCTNGLDDYHVNRLEWKEYGLEWRYNFIGEIISWMPFEPFKED